MWAALLKKIIHYKRKLLCQSHSINKKSAPPAQRWKKRFYNTDPHRPITDSFKTIRVSFLMYIFIHWQKAINIQKSQSISTKMLLFPNRPVESKHCCFLRQNNSSDSLGSIWMGQPERQAAAAAAAAEVIHSSGGSGLHL